ncbi:hypothetical protein ACFU99_08995 [Streptomyces sp. NPDC057654]|uniref:hypothetical protein n=1 Tax=Streptomyces sp. NPDC057654 TaxID=3346196 RepID=UPI0036BC9D85
MNVLPGAAALVAGCGLMWVSVIAKLADRESTAVVWPVTGRLRRLLGPHTVSAAECAAVAAMLAPLPVRLRLLLLTVCFSCYAVAAVVLRGRRCACFGSWSQTRFSMLHAAACAAVAALAWWGMLCGLPSPAATISAGSSVALASAAAAWMWRRSAARVRPPLSGIDRFVIYTSESCPYCSALEAQRSRYEALTDRPVEFRLADTDEAAEQAGRAFPAAVGYDADGIAVTEPVHGLAQIRDALRRAGTGPVPVAGTRSMR